MYVPKPKAAVRTEETFVLLKPDAAPHHDEILQLFFEAGLQITAKTFHIDANSRALDAMVRCFASVVEAEERDRDDAARRRGGAGATGGGTQFRTQNAGATKKMASFALGGDGRGAVMREGSGQAGVGVGVGVGVDDEDDAAPMTIVWRNRRGSDAHNGISQEILALATSKGAFGAASANLDAGASPFVAFQPAATPAESPLDQRFGTSLREPTFNGLQQQQQTFVFGRRASSVSLASSVGDGARHRDKTPDRPPSCPQQHQQPQMPRRINSDTDLPTDVLCERHKQHLITGGTSLALVLCGINAIARVADLVGPEDPAVAQRVAPMSVRARFGTSLINNAAFAAESARDAARLIALVFGFGTATAKAEEEGAAEAAAAGGGGAGSRRGVHAGFRRGTASHFARSRHAGSTAPAGMGRERRLSTSTGLSEGGAAGSNSGCGGGDTPVWLRPDDDALALDDDHHELAEKLRGMGLAAEDLVGNDDPLLALATAVVDDAPNVPEKLTSQRLGLFTDHLRLQLKTQRAHARLLRARELDLLLREQELQRRLDSMEGAADAHLAAAPNAAAGRAAAARKAGTMSSMLRSPRGMTPLDDGAPWGAARSTPPQQQCDYRESPNCEAVRDSSGARGSGRGPSPSTISGRCCAASTTRGPGFGLPPDPLDLVRDPFTLKLLFMRLDPEQTGRIPRKTFLRLYRETPELHQPGLEAETEGFVVQQLFPNRAPGKGAGLRGGGEERGLTDELAATTISADAFGAATSTLTATQVQRQKNEADRESAMSFDEFAILLLKLLQR